MCVFTPLPTLETKFSNENGNCCTTEVNYTVMNQSLAVLLLKSMMQNSYFHLKFIYSEKAKKFEIFYLVTRQKYCDIFFLFSVLYLNFIKVGFTWGPNTLYKTIVVFNLSVVLLMFYFCFAKRALDSTSRIFIVKGDDFKLRFTIFVAM